jgi:hypothetical protein
MTFSSHAKKNPKATLEGTKLLFLENLNTLRKKD